MWNRPIDASHFRVAHNKRRRFHLFVRVVMLEEQRFSPSLQDELQQLMPFAMSEDIAIGQHEEKSCHFRVLGEAAFC
jgi:hypothetical protein